VSTENNVISNSKP